MFHSGRVTYLADALWVSRSMLSSGSIVFAWKPSISALRSSWEVSAVRRWKSVAALCCSSLAALVPHLLFAVTCKGGTKPSLFTETKSGEGIGGAMQCELGAAIAGRAWGAQSSTACTGAALPAAEQSLELPPLLLSLGCQTLLAARADPAMLPSMPPPPSRGDGAANPRAVTSGQTLELPLGGWLPFFHVLFALFDLFSSVWKQRALQALGCSFLSGHGVLLAPGERARCVRRGAEPPGAGGPVKCRAPAPPETSSRDFAVTQMPGPDPKRWWSLLWDG